MTTSPDMGHGATRFCAYPLRSMGIGVVFAFFVVIILSELGAIEADIHEE
ncbi:MAG: hypothetical protein AAGI06_08790 [Pseudomonadota bacterium]